jgi:hypothetical protein
MEKKALIQVGYQILSEEEVEIHLAEDHGEEGFDCRGEFKYVIQDQELVDLIQHLGYVKLRKEIDNVDVVTQMQKMRERIEKLQVAMNTEGV